MWTPAYDRIFEYIERDVLRDAGIAASCRPRWSPYPKQAHSDEWPVVIPDVVFSVQIPRSESSRSPFAERAHEYHPARDFDGSQSSLLDVPLLLVEYNKCWGSGRDVGLAPHLRHLYAGMTAALALYDSLGIRTPIFGLFVEAVFEFSLFVGVFEYGEPVIHQVRIADYMSIFKVTNSIQMLHLYTVLANLQTLSTKVSLHVRGLLNVTEADLCPLQHEWSTRGEPVENRRVIDRAHPPLIAVDPLLQFLFARSVPQIVKWLQRGGITLPSRPASMATLPVHVQEWLCFFKTASPVSSTVVQGAVEYCKRGLPPRTHALVDSFWSAHSAYLMDRGARTTPDDDEGRLEYIAANLLYSISACARAQDLVRSPANKGHWLTLYRTLITDAPIEESKLRYNHQWAVHRCLRLPVRPEMAFFIPVNSLFYRRGEDRIFADFNIAGALDIDMPISVVEYVLTPENEEERTKHVAHLAVPMRSALAIWEMHQLASTAAFSLIATRSACYRDAPALYDSIDALIETHSSEVFDTVLREDYQSWKEPERILGGLYNRANPAESNRRIESWRKGVPKP
ncbi:hypothetical protein CPB85DRAFT_1308397 [Mucidula mucida]|nr:hypothetical protein CPB85DRAFT_1308397 [Mucidula mucida]